MSKTRDVYLRVRIDDKDKSDIHNAIFSELYHELETLYWRRVEE